MALTIWGSGVFPKDLSGQEEPLDIWKKKSMYLSVIYLLRLISLDSIILLEDR